MTAIFPNDFAPRLHGHRYATGDLIDVSFATPVVEDDVMRWNGSLWVPMSAATTAEIADLNAGAESAGTSDTYARGDHKHKLAAPPRCKVRRTAAVSIPHNSATTVTWDGEVEDTDAMFSGPASTITIKTAGWWRILVVALWAAGGAGRQIRLALPGLTLRYGSPMATSTLADGHLGEWEGSLAVNDTISVQVVQFSGAALDLNADSFVSARWTGP